MATQVSPNAAAPVAATGDRLPYKPIIIVSLLLVLLAGGVSQVLSGHVIQPEMGYTIVAPVAANLMALP
jgi:hypothetical protein